MDEMRGYMRLHWKTITMMVAGLILCGVMSTFTVPYAFRQWEADRSISIMRIFLGILSFVAGFAILALLLIERFKEKERWVRKVVLLIIVYVLLQLIAGSLWGFVGLLSYLKMGVSYENSQTIIDICIAVWQNFIRVFFLYLLITWLYDIDWRSHIKDFKMTFFVAACLAAIPILLNLLESNIFTKTIGLIWTCFYIVVFAVLIDNSLKGIKG